jgi:tetratricopeptide (TPR) repeat protein
MKWFWYLLLAALVGVSWMFFSRSGKDIDVKKAELTRVYELGDPDGKAAKIEEQVHGLEGTKTLNGVLLAFLTAGLVGMVVVADILPAFANRVTHAIYDSAEMMEHDVMHDARSLLAQGDFAGAIEAFKKAAAAEPLNRLPWVEIAKIYKDNLQDSASAIQTIRYALESQEWEVKDAAYFLFRLAELYDEVEGNRESAMAIMQQVIDEFPGTRHAANAAHKLHEWASEEVSNPESKFLDRLVDVKPVHAEPTIYELPPVDFVDDEPRRPV